ncbi:hypothetical protein KSX05_18560, partial [Phocaeicola massiliensis]|nr:hypothetical protein [Phocaeicola massiliensis]
MIVPGYGSAPSSDVIICHQMSWKSDFNIHLLLVNRRSDPFPKSGKFPVGSANNAFPLYSGRFSLT